MAYLTPKSKTPNDAPRVAVLRLQPKAKCSGHFKALADIQIDGLWAICGLQVVESRSGLEVFWPTDPDHNHTVKPLNLSLQRSIENAVLSAWQGVGGAL